LQALGCGLMLWISIFTSKRWPSACARSNIS